MGYINAHADFFFTSASVIVPAARSARSPASRAWSLRSLALCVVFASLMSSSLIFAIPRISRCSPVCSSGQERRGEGSGGRGCLVSCAKTLR